MGKSTKAPLGTDVKRDKHQSLSAELQTLLIRARNITNDRILRLPQVREKTGRATSTIWKDVKNRTLPPPIRIGTRSVGWRESEIDAVIAARALSARNNQPIDIKEFVASLIAPLDTTEPHTPSPDDSGIIHSDAYLKPLKDAKLPNIYHVADMKFFVEPSPKLAPGKIIEICLGALRELRKDASKPWRLLPQAMEPIEIEVLDIHCTINFRLPSPGAANINLHLIDNQLQISMPSPTQWKWPSTGLSWIMLRDFMNP